MNQTMKRGGGEDALFGAVIRPAMAEEAVGGPAVEEPPSGEAGAPAGERGSTGGASGCSTCGSASQMTPVYAIGTVDAYAPSVGVERELNFEIAQLSETPATFEIAKYEALKKNPHLARMMCWVLKIQEVESYILTPRTDRELAQLTDSLSPGEPGAPLDTEVIIGWKGPVRNCASLSLPSVVVENIYSYNHNAFVSVMAESLNVEKKSNNRFLQTSADFLARVQQIADNMGDLADHRAVNFLAVRFAPLYAMVARQSAEGRTLTEISCRPSRLASESQEIKDVVLTFQPIKPGVVEQWFVRVNVTDLYPFALSDDLQHFFER